MHIKFLKMLLILCFYNATGNVIARMLLFYDFSFMLHLSVKFVSCQSLGNKTKQLKRLTSCRPVNDRVQSREINHENISDQEYRDEK